MTRNRGIATFTLVASVAAASLLARVDERARGRPGNGATVRRAASVVVAPAREPATAASRVVTPLADRPGARAPGGGSVDEGDAIPARLGAALSARVTVHGGKPGLPDCIHLEAASPIAESRPIAAARAVLARAGAVLAPRWAVQGEGEAPGRGLALAPVRSLELGGNAVVVDFEASVDGTPVLDSTVKVELRHDGPGSFVPVRIWGPLHPDLDVEGAVSSAVESSIADRYPALSASGLRVAAEARLVVAPVAAGGYRRAFVVIAHPSLGESRRDVIDAGTGAVLDSREAACAGGATCLTYTRNPIDTPRTLETLNGLTVDQGTTSVVTAGDGSFPLSGTVTLDKGMSGPLVRALPAKLDNPLAFMGAHLILAPELLLTYSGAADFTLESAPGDESTSHQDEVSAFFAATSYNAYVRATYPLFVAPAEKRFAFCLWGGTANFVAGSAVFDGDTYAGYINLGTILVTPTDPRPLARDVTIVRHEYTHGLFMSIVPNLPYGGDGNSLNEFLADYFPCAQLEDPRWGEYGGPVFFRDLSGTIQKLIYPQDAGTPSSPSGEPHRIGNIVGQAVWEARTAAEARTAGARLAIDQAVLEGVVRFPPAPTLAQAREAIIAADLAINAGANGTILAAAFYDHGIGDAPPVNAPPSIAVAASGTVVAGEALTVSVVSVSQNGSPVTLAASSPSLALSFQSTTGTTARATLTGTPGVSSVGSHTVTITATAGTARTQSSFTILVTAPLAIALATGGGTAVAPASIASAYGPGLAGTTVSVTDAAGVERAATVFYSSATQINFLVPDGTASGIATVAAASGGSATTGTVVVAAVAPGVFSADGTGSGLAAATLVRVHADGSRSDEAVTATPIDLGVAAGDEVVLTLYATGIRGAAAPAAVTIGGVSATVLYSGAQGTDPGLDQVNVVIPPALAGKGTVPIVLACGGATANAVSIAIR
jgi:uncharacterized protein (TIGR03437 family)